MRRGLREHDPDGVALRPDPARLSAIWARITSDRPSTSQLRGDFYTLATNVVMSQMPSTLYVKQGRGLETLWLGLHRTWV